MPVVNHNIDWAVDDENQLLGYMRPNGDIVSIARFADPAGSALVGPDGVERQVGASRRVHSLLGVVALDLPTLSGLPAGASFSGSGSYDSAGVLAVQSTGTITHNPTGWYDGTACLEFTPNSDTAEFRIYLGSTGVNISDDDGIAFRFGIPDDLDASKSNFSIGFDFSSDASSLFPTNTQYVRIWVCDEPTATGKEKGGKKYIRQMWDATAATDAACGAWPGYINTGVYSGSGADRTVMCKWVRFRCSKFDGKTLKFKSVLRGGRSTPAIVLGSDSITPEDLALRAYGYMAGKGLRGYVNQYLTQLSSDSASLDRVRRIYAAGHEVCGNDVQDRALGSSVTDEATMRAAITTTRDTLRDSYGFRRGSRVWIANNNSSSALMIRELRSAGYVANRNGAGNGRYVFPEGGVDDPYRLPATGIDGKNFADMQAYVNRAVVLGASAWFYWHGVISSARIDADRTANVTGTAGAPVARSGSETPAQYRARCAALGTAAGTASVAYFDARLGSSALGVWWEELKELFDYLALKNSDGTLAVVTPEEWCRDVGLL